MTLKINEDHYVEESKFSIDIWTKELKAKTY